MVSTAGLTSVAVSWRQKKRNHRLLFGTPVRKVRLDWRRQLAIFECGEIFGYERWTGTRFGTDEWQVFVLQAGAAGAPLSAVPGIRPGARILLSAYGKDRCRKALQLIEMAGLIHPLEQLNAERWAVLGSKLAAGFSPDAGGLAR